jgi:cysteine protease ATG4
MLKEDITQTSSDLLVENQHDIGVYVSTDAVLYLDEIERVCFPDEATSWRPLFILIPLRLGLDSLNEVYYPQLQATYRFPQSVGIIGGKPRAAMYFVAYQDNLLYYLDPHTSQPYQPFSVDSEAFAKISEVSSFITKLYWSTFAGCRKIAGQ